MASDELAAKLNKRNNIIDRAEAAAEDGVDFEPEKDCPSMQVFNPYTEFKEFSRKEIQNYQKMFKEYDTSRDKFIDFEELKRMMEKLGAPQTHLALKEMIREVDEDQDNKISFREFLLIFRKARAGELDTCSGLMDIFRFVSEIDVDKEGVKGAKNFFQAKIEEQTFSNKFEQEIKDEQEERRRQEEEAKTRKAAFKNKATFFQDMIQS